MPTTNRPAKPPDDLQSAFAQIKKKQDRAKRGGKKRGGDFKMVAQYWLKNLLILVVLVALVMLVDGIRREGRSSRPASAPCRATSSSSPPTAAPAS